MARWMRSLLVAAVIRLFYSVPVMTDELHNSQAQIRRAVLKQLLTALKANTVDEERAAYVAQVLLSTLEQTHSLTQLHEQLPELETELGEIGKSIEPILQQLTEHLKQSLVATIDKLAAEKKIKKLHTLVAVAYDSEVTE